MALESVFEVFDAELKVKAEELGKTCIVLNGWSPPEENEDDEDEDYQEREEPQPTLEELRALPKIFILPQASAAMEEVGKELGAVGCDGPDDPFRMTNTASSYDGHDIITKHLKDFDKMMRQKAYKDAFCKLLGITLASAHDDFWYMDTDVPEDVEKIMKKLTAAWGKVWARPDEELGGVSEQERQLIRDKFKEMKDEVKKRLRAW